MLSIKFLINRINFVQVLNCKPKEQRKLCGYHFALFFFLLHVIRKMN